MTGKKSIVLLIALLAVYSGVSAADTSIGFMQSIINTSFLVDAESRCFGAESSIGTPTVLYAIKGFDVLCNDNNNLDLGFSFSVGVMANVYFKVINGDIFSLRLGLQGDIICMFKSDSVWAAGFMGPSIGLNYKVNGDFAVNITSAVPFDVFIPESISKYTYFVCSSNQDDVSGNISRAVFGSIGAIGCQLARLSFKWSV